MSSGRVLIGVNLGGDSKKTIIRNKIGDPRGLSWTLKRPKSPKISLKMGNNRLYLVITTKI
jgi:hypothetical protein